MQSNWEPMVGGKRKSTKSISAFGFAIFRLPFGFWISPCAFRLLVLASCLSTFGLSVYLIAY